MIIINAHSRLQAQSLNDVSLRPKLALRELDRCTRLLNSSKVYTSLGKKGGVELGHINKETFILSVKSEAIGYLITASSSYGIPGVKRKVDAVYVDVPHRGKGLGLVLYLGTLHVLNHLASDTSLSKGAVNMWYGLQRYGYDAKLWNTAIDRPTEFEWGDNNIPLIDGRPMTKSRLDYVFYI